MEETKPKKKKHKARFEKKHKKNIGALLLFSGIGYGFYHQDKKHKEALKHGEEHYENLRKEFGEKRKEIIILRNELEQAKQEHKTKNEKESKKNNELVQKYEVMIEIKCLQNKLLKIPRDTSTREGIDLYEYVHNYEPNVSQSLLELKKKCKFLHQKDKAINFSKK